MKNPLANLSLKAKTFILLVAVALLSTLPLIAFSLKAIESVSLLGTDRDIEQVLVRAVDAGASDAEKQEAAVAVMKYRQIEALKKGIIEQVLAVSLVYFIVVVGISLLLGYLFIVKITRPLVKLTEATRRIAGDNLEERLTERAGGEVGTLIESFNRMQADLKLARDQRAIAERRATWQQVARTIAHEIKNPLTPIRLSTERMYDKFLNKKPDFPEVIKSTTETILAEIENLQRLVDTFHQYAKFPDPVLGPEALNQIVRETAEIFKGGDYDLVESLDEKLPVLQLDRGQVRQAMTNLLKNAAEAVEGGKGRGRIGVSTEYRDAKVILSVSDNGCGISAENMRRLFQPYFTTKKHGSGIGLALTERIVSLNGGKIYCESKEGEGTKFTILFGA